MKLNINMLKLAINQSNGSVKEIANLYGCSRATIYKWIKKDKRIRDMIEEKQRDDLIIERAELVKIKRGLDSEKVNEFEIDRLVFPSVYKNKKGDWIPFIYVDHGKNIISEVYKFRKLFNEDLNEEDYKYFRSLDIVR